MLQGNTKRKKNEKESIDSKEHKNAVKFCSLINFGLRNNERTRVHDFLTVGERSKELISLLCNDSHKTLHSSLGVSPSSAFSNKQIQKKKTPTLM